MSKAPSFNPQEKTLIMQTVTWVKTVNDAKPAGAPPSYPSQTDIDSSALFKRIRRARERGRCSISMRKASRGRHGARIAGSSCCRS